MGPLSNILRLPSNKSSELKAWYEENKECLTILLDAYCLIDTENRVVEFNSAFMDLVGLSYRKILKVGNFCELLKTEKCQPECIALQVINTGENLRLDGLKGSTAIHQNLTLILSAIAIRDKNKELLGCLLTVRDVTAETKLQEKYMERKQESVTDGLTQIYNKMFVEQILLKTVQLSLRESKTFSVLMCDIDHFKKINDTYGHQAGDVVIQTFANLLKVQVRGSDVVGRFGGEEFVIVLMNSNIEGSVVFAERMRKKFQDMLIEYNGQQLKATVSIGITVFDDKWKDGTNPEKLSSTLLKNADEALYEAKKTGRNRVCIYKKI